MAIYEWCKDLLLAQCRRLLRDDPAKAVTGVICWFSDGTQKVSGSSSELKAHIAVPYLSAY